MSDNQQTQANQVSNTPQPDRKRVKTLIKRIALGLGIIAALYAASTWQDYQGMFEYNALCEKDAGLHVYEKLEKNVGWEADFSQRGTLKDLTHVAFIRAKNSKGELVDITYKGGPVWKEESYNIVSANQSVPVKYKVEDANVKPIRLDSKTNRVVWSLVNLSNKKIMVEAIQYSNHNHPLKRFIKPLGIVRCPLDDSFPTAAQLNQTIFKD